VATPEDKMVQRPHHYALVDEADNIFIDEARTPLIISSPTRPATPEEQIVYLWANNLVLQMKPEEHFTFDIQKQKLVLTEAGTKLARYSNPPSGPHGKAMDKLEEAIEQALQAHYRFRRDQHYMIDKGKIVIIDEFTGRRMPDRHWRDGLHQAVEAKEGVTINQQSDHAAQITYQSYFRLYKKLSGMTGTAAQNRWEIRRVYKIWVVCVPTNRPIRRVALPDRVFPNEDVKFDAVVQDIIKLRDAGRSVLVGTRSVEKSEKLSEKLKAAGVEHQVLNARQHEQEAKIIAQAGLRGRVTIATNMAGRGTDIKPAPEVIAAGGLHVLGTERHEALRIDRQLMGRSGRQGDPGTAQFFLSLEDELLEGLGPRRQEKWKEFGLRGGDRDWDGYLFLFRRAQRRVERRHYRNRVDLLVHEKQRQEILKDLGADPYVD
jgi:preprotein translocase subunit SecA